MVRSEALAQGESRQQPTPPRLRSGHNGSTLLERQTSSARQGAPPVAPGLASMLTVWPRRLEDA